MDKFTRTYKCTRDMSHVSTHTHTHAHTHTRTRTHTHTHAHTLSHCFSHTLSHTHTYPHTHGLTHVNSILGQCGDVCTLLSSQAICTLSPERFRLERQGFCAKTEAQHRNSKHDCTLLALSSAHVSPAKHASGLALSTTAWSWPRAQTLVLEGKAETEHGSSEHGSTPCACTPCANLALASAPPIPSTPRGVVIFNNERLWTVLAKIQVLVNWTVLRKMIFSRENQTKAGYSVCFAHLFLPAWRKRSDYSFF